MIENVVLRETETGSHLGHNSITLSATAICMCMVHVASFYKNVCRRIDGDMREIAVFKFNISNCTVKSMIDINVVGLVRGGVFSCNSQALNTSGHTRV